MTDAQDTIELPVFGLTLKSDYAGWYRLFDSESRSRVAATSHAFAFVTADIKRGGPSGVNVSYGSTGNDIDDACNRILAQMTPDDVAAIRALGERS